MMSATPIPRSLAMSGHADLDVSVIDELPGGRQPITTKLVSEQRRAEIVRPHPRRRARWSPGLLGVSADRESESWRRRTSRLQNATALHEELTAAMPDVRAALLHGRMKAEEAAIMADFAANRIQGAGCDHGDRGRR